MLLPWFDVCSTLRRNTTQITLSDYHIQKLFDENRTNHFSCKNSLSVNSECTKRLYWNEINDPLSGHFRFCFLHRCIKEGKSFEGIVPGPDYAA